MAESLKKPENPLKRFFAVEERPDGVYLKIEHETRNTIDLAAVKAALEAAMVLNYDWDKITDVVTRARGAFERVGPPLEYYNVDFDRYVDLRITPLKATVTVSSSCIADRLRPTEKMLVRCLNRKGVLFGIIPDAVSRTIRESLFDTDVVVAEGIAAEDGRNAGVKYEIEVHPDRKPRVLPDGSVDFRDIQTFPQVAEGQVIARKIPPEPGKPGRTVTGEDLPAKPGTDRELVKGKHITVSDDGKFLMVTKAGIIYEEGGILNIKENLTLSKDVDYSIGNIKFTGAIQINGNVLPGFTVESDADILIKGQVEGATVRSRNGSVIVERGVIGKHTAVIFGKKGVSLTFAQEATISTEGSLEVDRYLLHCTCTCETCEMLRPGAELIGGTLTVYGWARLGNAGNEKNLATTIVCTDRGRAVVEDKYRELLELHQKLDDDMQKVNRQLASKAAIFKKSGSAATDRQKDDLKKWIDQRNALGLKVGYVAKKLEELKTTLAQPVDMKGYVLVAGTVFPGVRLDLYGITKQIDEPAVNRRFVTRPTGIEIEGPA